MRTFVEKWAIYEVKIQLKRFLRDEYTTKS